MAERQCVAGVEGLAAEATRKSSRRKCHPLTYEQKSENARVGTQRLLNLMLSKSLNDFKMRGGVILNSEMSKSLKRLEFKLRDGENNRG